MAGTLFKPAAAPPSSTSAHSPGVILRLSQPSGPLACSTLLVLVDARLPELTKQLSTSCPCSSWSSVSALSSPPPILLALCPLTLGSPAHSRFKKWEFPASALPGHTCVYSIIEIFSCSLITGSLHACLPQRLHIHLWFPEPGTQRRQVKI